MLEVVENRPYESSPSSPHHHIAKKSNNSSNKVELIEKIMLKSPTMYASASTNTTPNHIANHTNSLHIKTLAIEESSSIGMKTPHQTHHRSHRHAVDPISDLYASTTLPIRRSCQNLDSAPITPCSHCKKSSTRRKPCASETLSHVEFLTELEKILNRQFNPLVSHVIKQVNNSEQRLEEKEKLEIIEREWSDVAMIFDHILCYLFCFITLTSCLLIFANSPHVLSNW